MLQIGGTESDAASKHFAGIKRQIQRTDEERREADHIQAVCAGAEKDRYGSIREEGHEKKNTDLLVFFIVTACVTILEGVFGMLFFPEITFGYKAFFSPPIFGTLSALSGFVTDSERELTEKEMLFRLFLQLVLIELLVFGANYFYVDFEMFTWKVTLSLILAIALIFVLVYAVMWLNEYRMAQLFNARLQKLQEEVSFKQGICYDRKDR